MSEVDGGWEPGAAFEQATNEYLAELYAAEPVMATAMGVHDGDEQLPDLSRPALAERLRRARAYLHRIDRLSLISLTMDERLDYRLARADTQMTISSCEQARPFERQPGLYAEIALYGVFLLLARDFARVETRAACALRRLEAIPAFLQIARENLQDPPRLFVEIGIEVAEGGQAFFAQSVPAFARQVRGDTLRTGLLEAARDAQEALADFVRYLRERVLPGAGEDFALGREMFDYRLRIGHLMEETADDLLEIGREEMEAAKAALQQAGAEIDPSRSWPEIVADLKRQHPAASELTETYAREVERARQFVADRRLLDLPENETLRVAETPAFARATLPYAAYLPPAPFEPRQEGLLWVTLVDGSLTAERQEALLQEHSQFAIPVIALHEGYPGHHLQRTLASRHPSRVRRHFGQNALFAEGWALYCEEMMHESGFYDDPRARLMQLRDRLWRACRVVVDAQLHTRTMTFEEAVRFLVDEARLEESNARAEVRRYALTPTQPMSCVLGRRALQNIRAAVQKRQGARFELRRFHNALLSYGAVQPRLLREAMLMVG